MPLPRFYIKENNSNEEFGDRTKTNIVIVTDKNGTDKEAITSKAKNGNNYVLLERTGLETWEVSEKALPKINFFEGLTNTEHGALAVIDNKDNFIAFLGGKVSGNNIEVSKIQYPDGTINDLEEKFDLKLDNNVINKKDLEYLNATVIELKDQYAPAIDKRKVENQNIAENSNKLTEEKCKEILKQCNNGELSLNPGISSDPQATLKYVLGELVLNGSSVEASGHSNTKKTGVKNHAR